MYRNSDKIEPRARDREKTLSQLEMALHRLQKLDEKVSISSVAKEAGVTPSLIHNRYPDFAEKIRGVVGKNVRDQRASLRQEVIAERSKNRLLREQITELRAEIVKLASINESVRAQLVIQTALASKKLIPLPVRLGGSDLN